MNAEKTQKEIPSRPIQTEPGRGRVYMEDNRPESVGQTKFINTIQLKEKNQLYPIIQRTKITKSISQSSSESSLDGVIDLEKKEDVESLLSNLMQEGNFSAALMGEALRLKIANSYDHPDATWEELFGDYLTGEDRKAMTEAWNDWFGEPAPWVVRDGEKEEKKEEEKKEEEKKFDSYKGVKINPFSYGNEKGEFVGNPKFFHIHIVKDKTHLKLGKSDFRVDIHNNNWESDCKKALKALLYSGLSSVKGFDDCLCWLCQEADIDVDAARKMWTQREKKA